MHDLNSNLFYKTKFQIALSHPGDDSDLLWKLICHIATWMTGKWNRNGKYLLPTIKDNPKYWSRIKTGTRIHSLDKEKSIFIEGEYFKDFETGQINWACQIVEPPDRTQGYATRQWTTEIGYEERTPGTAMISCVIGYGDIPGFYGPCKPDPDPSLPGIITNLLFDSTITCSLGCDTISKFPKKLCPGDWPEFWRQIIDPQRELPYVYISPRADRDDEDNIVITNMVDPKMLARLVCGNARVFYSDDIDFSTEMSYCLDIPEKYYCKGGTVRIYVPGVDLTSQNDSYRHHFFTVNEISTMGEDEVIAILRRVFSQDVNFYDTFVRVPDCKKLREQARRKARLAELIKAHTTHVSEVEQSGFEELLKEAEEREKAEDRCLELELELEEAKSEIYSKSVQLDAFRLAVQQAAEKEKALASREEISQYPDDPISIINYFQSVFGDRIAFSDDAIKSAKKCTIPNKELWFVLHHLATTMRDLFINGSKQPYDEFKNRTGYKCAHGEGSATRKDNRLMRQFSTTYKGKTVDIEPHITWSDISMSIHLRYIADEEIILVGHCGEHLEIYSTRKRK